MPGLAERMSDDKKLKSARGRPEIERELDEGLDPLLPASGPVDVRPNPFTNRTWDEPLPRISAPRAPAPKDALSPAQDDAGAPGTFPAAPQPSDPEWLVQLKDVLRGALRASREVMGSGQAYAGISLVMANDEEIEVVWEIGVGRLNATRGEGEKQGPAYDTRDLWGRGGSLEDALQKAHTEKNPRGGRRG
jgi:hypothetical protein